MHPPRRVLRIRHVPLLALAAVQLLASACANTNNVRFSGNPRTVSAPPATVRLFIDRDGRFYPSAGQSIQDVRLERWWNLLDSYYREASERRQPEWLGLLARYGVPDGPFETAWEAVQDSIAATSAREAIRTAGEQPLIVLVHGFNNTAAEAEQALAATRGAIDVHLGFPQRYLEVYWDGAAKRGGFWSIFRVWGGGQHNSYNAGLALRRILNQIPPATPVRIVTHSLGGSVATAALWNVTSKIDSSVDAAWLRTYERLRNDTIRHRTPSHPDLRLAMLVPAMPGNTFCNLPVRGARRCDYHDRTPAGDSTQHRVIVGVNRSDWVVNKFFVPSSKFGSTTLAARLREYRDRVKPLNEPGEPQRFFCLDFSKSSVNTTTPVLGESHAWEVYVQRDAFADFIDLLMNRIPGASAHTCVFPAD
jgi:hypothetical protein